MKMRQKNLLHSLRSVASKTVFGFGIAVIGVLAIPAGIIIEIIIMIWSAIDRVMNALE